MEGKLPKPLFERAFSKPFRKTISNRHYALFLAELVERGYLSTDCLLKPDEQVLKLLRSLMLSPSLLDNQHCIPWEKLNHYEQLLTYSQLFQHIGNPSDIEPTIECISLAVKQLFSSIPSGARPRGPEDAPFSQSVTQIVEKDLQLRRMISQSVFKFLLEKFLDDPAVPLQDRFDGLTAAVQEKLQGEPLHIPLLERQVIHKSGNVDYIYKDESANLESYLNGILWLHLSDELNASLFPDQHPPSLEERLTLLWGANAFAKGKKGDNAKIITALFDLLHQHMLVEEDRRLAVKLRKRLMEPKTLNNRD